MIFLSPFARVSVAPPLLMEVTTAKESRSSFLLGVGKKAWREAGEGGSRGETADERGSAEKKMESECRYGDREEAEEEGERGLGDGGWGRGESCAVEAEWAVQVKTGDGGVFVAVVGPIFLLVHLRQRCLVLRQFVLGEGLGGVLGLAAREMEGLATFWAPLVGRLGWGGGLVFGVPPACLGAEGGGGASSQRAGVGHGAEGKVQLSEEAKVLASALSGRHARELGGGEASLAEPLPQAAGLAATRPGVVVEAQELDALDVPHGLAGELGQGVVEQVEDGQATQVAECFAVDLPDSVVVDEQAVQVD